MTENYRIVWQTSCGFKGYGEYCVSAEHVLDSLVKKHPSMKHWLEVEPAVEKQQRLQWKRRRAWIITCISFSKKLMKK